MIYLSKPNGTYGVFRSKTSQGAYEIHKLEPGASYVNDPDPWAESFCGQRDTLSQARGWADACDANA